MSTIFSLSL
ncbi:hypothetical protein EC82524_4175A, partial [Escherichia coli 8.2524]